MSRIPRRSRYLFTVTRRTHLQTGEIFHSRTSRCASVDLLYDGKWAGVLRLNSRPEGAEQVLLDSLGPITNDIVADCPPTHVRPVELVEISAGSVEYLDSERKSFDEWYRPGFPGQEGLYEFYNVMWVERNNGIVYRKALGRVVKATWEAAALERIELTLG
jgi:hypothetical protein